MSQRTSYAQGTPNWVGLLTTDPDAAKSFYGQLFGWWYDDLSTPEGRVYSMAAKDGDDVATIGLLSPDLTAQGAPLIPMWHTTLAVDDVDAVAARVEPGGGKLLMAPYDFMDAGRETFVVDPTGAVVGLWQAKARIGATRVNEPGTMAWNELVTDDEGAAVAFYQQVLGLTPGAMDFGEGTYTTFSSGADTVAGTTPAPPGVPNHWHVYFAVEDASDAAQRATELGGTVVNGPRDTPIGAMAMLRDPQGVAFSIFAANPATS